MIYDDVGKTRDNDCDEDLCSCHLQQPYMTCYFFLVIKNILRTTVWTVVEEGQHHINSSQRNSKRLLITDI